MTRKLGGGGMGIVFLARDEELDRNVAVKIVRPDEALLDEPHPRFHREVDAIARLHHQGIVSIHEAGFDRGLSWYAMEWVPGCTLSELLDAVRPGDPARLTGRDARDHIAALAGGRGTRSESSDSTASGSALFSGDWSTFAFRVAKRVSDALQHAHENGVVHRDVKSSNIMVTADGRVVLLDFGLAISEGETTITRSGVALGSLPYMAPEQVHGWTSSIDARTDVYGLGVTLYELATLRLPFKGDSDETTRQRVLSHACVSASALNPQLTWDAETVIEVAMDPDPRRRYQRADSLSNDLRRVLEGEPIEARRPGTLVRLQRWVKAHPTSSSATILSLVAALFLAWGLIRTQQQADDLQRVVDDRTALNTLLLDMLQEETSILDAGMVEGRTLDLADLYEARRSAVERFQGRTDLQARFETYLGRMARRLGRYQEAHDHQRAALALYQSLTDGEGDRDLDVAATLTRLAEDLGRLGKLDEANAACDRALTITAEVAGTNSTRYADVLVARALIEDIKGEIGTSQRTLRNALAILERRQPAAGSDANRDHMYRLNLALAHHRLGTSYLRSSLPEEARNELIRANALFDGVPNQRVHQAEAGCHLASCALMMEKPREALDRLAEAEEIQRRYLAPDDIIAYQIQFERGRAHWQTNERELAIKELTLAIEGFTRDHISDRSKAPGARVAIAYYLMQLGRHDDARRHLETAQRECEEVADPLFSSSVDWALADVLEDQGHADEAMTLRPANIDEHAKALGKDHARVVSYRLTYARTCGLAGEASKAAALLTQVLDWCERVPREDAAFVTRSLGPLYTTPVLASLIDDGEIERAGELAVRVAHIRLAAEGGVAEDAKREYVEALVRPFRVAGEYAKAREVTSEALARLDG